MSSCPAINDREFDLLKKIAQNTCELASGGGGGGGITALTGDVTATGPGSAASTLATVNASPGTFAGITVNGKGLVTGASALTIATTAPLTGGGTLGNLTLGVSTASTAQTTAQTSSSVVLTPANYGNAIVPMSAPQLAKWLKNGVSGKIICLVGDSTTWQIDGVTAAAVATVSGGAVTSIGSITNPTGGYSRYGGGWNGVAPTIVITGDGTGATAHAVLTGASITSIVVDSGGSGYTYADVNIVSLSFLEYQTPNGPLNGVTVLNFGNNGQTLQSFITDSGHYGLTHTIATRADLYVFDYGINDVRQGARTQNQISADLVSAISSIRAGNPSASIILRMPNTFLTTDVGGIGYVVPNASAQAYSTILANVYRGVANQWPDVLLYDSHYWVWTDTCVASSSIMADQIHPLYYKYDIAQIASLASNGLISGKFIETMAFAPVSRPLTGSQYMSAQNSLARGVSTSVPYNTYFRSVEDTDNYQLIVSGTINNSGSGFIDITLPNAFTQNSLVLANDILYQDGQQPFVLTQASQFLSAGIMRIPMTPTFTLTNGRNVSIYRQPWFGDSNIQTYYQNTAQYPFRTKITSVAFAGNGNFWVNMDDGRILTTSDVLVVPGHSPLTLTGATFGSQNADGTGYIKIIKAGTDFTGWTVPGYIFGGSRLALQPSGIPAVPQPGEIWFQNGRLGVQEGTAGVFSSNTIQTSGFIMSNVGLVRVTADVTSSSTTLANVTGLSASLSASTSYSFEATLIYDADATGGHQYAVGGTATATNIIYHIDSVSDASGLNVITSRQTALAGAAGQAGSTAGITRIRGSITVNAAGTLTIQFAQNAGPNGSSVIKRGSYFRIWQD